MNSKNGKITREFFSTVHDRLNNKHFIPNFKLTQVITEHGDSNFYLHRFKIKTTDRCRCGLAADTFCHRMFECISYAGKRDKFETNVRRNHSWPPEMSVLMSDMNLFMLFNQYCHTL
jgi:hypothetical protein